MYTNVESRQNWARVFCKTLTPYDSKTPRHSPSLPQPTDTQGTCWRCGQHLTRVNRIWMAPPQLTINEWP